MSKKTENPQMVTTVPLKTFTGWPNGYDASTEEGRRGVLFKAGVESVAVPEDYAAILRDKGLVAGPASTKAAGE